MNLIPGCGQPLFRSQSCKSHKSANNLYKMHIFHCYTFIFLILLLNGSVYSESDNIKINFRELWRNQVAKFNRGTAQLNFHPIRRLQAVKQSLLGSLNHNNNINNIEANVDSDENSHFITKFLSWTISRMVLSKTIDTKGLKVKVEGISNNNLIRGHINKVMIKFNQLKHSQFTISGGGKLMVRDLEVDFRRMLFRNLPFVEHPYTIHCDFNLTQDDIMQSLLIRKSLQNCVNSVMTRFLGSRNIASVLVTEVYVNNSRLYTLGSIAAWSDSSLSLYFGSKSNKPNSSGLVNMGFEVSTRLGVRENNPHVVYFEDVIMVLNPSLPAERITLPISADTTVDIDLGDLCTVESLQVAHDRVHFAVSVVISPQLALSTVERGGAESLPLIPESTIVGMLFSSLWVVMHTCAVYLNYAAALCGLSSAGSNGSSIGSSSSSSSSWTTMLPTSWWGWLSSTSTPATGSTSSSIRNTYVKFNISSALSNVLKLQGGAKRGSVRRSVLAWWFSTSPSKEVQSEIVCAAVY